MTFHAIIVAGGTGSRSGGRKQWMPLGGKQVLDWSVEAFAEAGAGHIVVVVPEDDLDQAQARYRTMARVVVGGADRAASVSSGLDALTTMAALDDVVMIHDAARPLLKPQHINSLSEKLETARAAILALPVTDSLKRGTDTIIDAPARDGLWRAQTPQAFRLGDIAEAYSTYDGPVATDEAMIAGAAGIDVALVEGDMRLHKLTYPSDFALLEAFIVQDKPLKDIRIGQGFDAHRWGDGDSVWLCGVEIANTQTLIGHSDADAGLHALTDALLGAVGLGDIGDHFPPTDPQWKGASSDRFLAHAAKLIAERGGDIVNVDVTLICERPKIKPHREAMRQRVADILGIAVDRVSVKATTTEGMGFTGRQEGLAAQAVCSVALPV